MFFDFDNDGWNDLFDASGHVYPQMDGRSKETYRQPLQLFRNMHNGKFAEISADSGLLALPLKSARGGAYCDYDNDGDIDVVVSNIDDAPQLLENVGGNRANWLELKLVGTTSNRDAIGAAVKVVAGNSTQFQHVRAGGSFISGNDLRLHFGLADKELADRIEIRWPSGKTETLQNVKSNQIVLVKEGSGIGVSPYRPFRTGSPRIPK
jgi:hypothetical protein